MQNNGFSVPEIEQAAISCIMQWPECRHQAGAILKEEFFHSIPNRVLFGELAKSSDFELIEFTQRLRDAGQLDQIGGAYYVTETCCNTAHSPKAFPWYVDRLLEEHERRELISTCSESIQMAAGGLPDVVSQTITAVNGIPIRRRQDRTFADALDAKMERLQTGAPDADIISTGIRDLDRDSPLHKGDMPLIVGERKAGKSILALSIVVNVARAGLPVAYFSLEDREPKVLDRIFAGLTRIPLSVSHVSRMNPLEINRAQAMLKKAHSLPITIIDDMFDLSAIISRTRSLVGLGIGLVVIDYAQLIRVSGCDSRREEVERVSRDLRLLAMETEAPVILLCQLNKEGETRETKALEMDCTAAWKVDFPADNKGKPQNESNERYIRIPFQRNGESGISIRVTFLGSIARIENYEPVKNGLSDDDL